MSSGSDSSVSRRVFLASGTAMVTAFAGCSSLGEQTDGLASLDRVVAGTSQDSSVRSEFTLLYAQPEGSTRPLLRGVHPIPQSDEPLVLDGFDVEPGFYSLTVDVEGTPATEVNGFNSSGPAVGSDDVQFEVFIDRNGDLDINLGTAGDELSNPN